MQRREVLRLLGTGAVLQLAPNSLFAVLAEARAVLQTSAAPRTLDPHQYATVNAVAEMIIPRTDTPGAADVGAADFIDLLLTEWFEDADRARFLNGLRDVDGRTQKLFAKDFVHCSAAQQSQILMDLGSGLTRDPHSSRTQALTGRRAKPAHNFYVMLRQFTLTAYYTSEAGATGELHFEMIPGVYEGCSQPSVKEAAQRK